VKDVVSVALSYFNVRTSMLQRSTSRHNTPRVPRVSPVDPDIPFAAFVGGIELDIDAAFIRKNAANFIVGPVIVAGIVEAQELDALTGTVDDCHVSLVCRE
jgi:hypothetical protein